MLAHQQDTQRHDGGIVSGVSGRNRTDQAPPAWNTGQEPKAKSVRTPSMSSKRARKWTEREILLWLKAVYRVESKAISAISWQQHNVLQRRQSITVQKEVCCDRER